MKVRRASIIYALIMVALLPYYSAAQIVTREWSLKTTIGPSPRDLMEMVYDSRRQVSVLYGGLTDSGVQSDTWEWNGANWSNRSISLSSSPGPRYWYGMTFDVSRGVTVLFGGNDDIGVRHNDVWEYDGANWTHRMDILPDPVYGFPPPNVGMAFTYDSDRQLIVMHGGDRFNDDFSNREVWEYDGNSWIRKANAPDSRRYHTMAYHEGIQRILRYGGYPESNLTHSYDGISWTNVLQRLDRNYYSLKMAYDAHVDQVVMFSGHTHNQKTWVNNGTKWVDISGELPNSPSGRDGYALTYDSTRECIVLFGGNTNSGRSGETWCLGVFPIVEYSFDEGSGNIAFDSSGNVHNGFLQNGLTYSSDAIEGPFSVQFDGIDDRIDVPRQALEGLDNRTFQMWVKTTANSGFLFDFDRWGGCCPGDYMALNGDGTVNGHHFSGGDINISSVTPINDGQWHHVALSLSSANGAKLFIDGNLEASHPTGAIAATASGNNHFVIGCETSGNSPNYYTFFNGEIDEFKVEDIARTSFTLDLPGPAIDLLVESINLAQVVFDPDINDDGKVDLVLGKETVAKLIITATGPELVDEGQAIQVSLSTDTVVFNSITTTVAQLRTGDPIFMFFHPLIEGDLVISVSADSDGDVPEINENNNQLAIAVTVKDTDAFTIAYRKVIACLPPFDCYEPPEQDGVEELVSNSSEFLLATLPIDDSEFSAFLVQDYVGDPIPVVGMADDAISVYMGALLSTLGSADRAVGIVSDSYFNYHQLSGIGVAHAIGWLNFPGVLVQEGFWTTVAHEIGHSYDLPLVGGEEYVLTPGGSCCSVSGNIVDSGYWVSRGVEIQGRTCFMGTDPGGVTGLNTRWIESEDYAHLFRRFRKSSVDPELLIISGKFSADGSAQITDWYTLPEGQLIEPVPGDKAIRFLNASNTIVSEVSFSTSFRMFLEPHGEFISDSAPFVLAIEYPEDALSVQIINNAELVYQLSLSGKLLKDAINHLPDRCIDNNNPGNIRKALQKKIDALDSIIGSGNLPAAINKLKNDIMDKFEKWLIDGCEVSDPLQISKAEILELSQMLLHRLENQ